MMTDLETIIFDWAMANRITQYTEIQTKAAELKCELSNTDVWGLVNHVRKNAAKKPATVWGH